MSKNVLFLIPGHSISPAERNKYINSCPDFDFLTIDPRRPVKDISQKLHDGIQIVVGRGKTAYEIRRTFPNKHVVEIPITAYDVLRSIGTVDYKDKTIAVITNKAEIIGLELFAEICNIRILNYMLTPFSEIHKAISEAADRGADLVLGGYVTEVAAQSMKMPCVPFLLGPESMQFVINEVRQVLSAIEMETQRQGFVNKLMDNILEGVIAVDNDNVVTSVNSVATRILSQSNQAVIGQPLASLGETFSSLIKDEAEEGVICINNNMFMFNRIPLMHNTRCFGTIYTLHEGRKISSMEKSIRTEVYAKGHVVRYNFDDVLGTSPAVRNAIEYGKNYARTESNILITGESGTGKEVFAQGIHYESSRQKMPFVAVNCAALPNELLHSELFGYVEGAFTGALRKGKVGLFEIAHNGTLFLDEISEMPYATQGNLLRVIQERYVVRLGSHKPIAIDTRIIAATNQSLQDLVKEGKFREDLYYRLNVLALTVPPLRQRIRDIAPLMLHFLNMFPSVWQGRFVLSPGVRECLENYSWPGNVRELSNVAERITATAKSAEISVEQMRWAMQMQHAPLIDIAEECALARQNKRQEQLEEIKRALAECNGNLSAAARLLGIDRTTLWRRMKKGEGKGSV